MADAAKCEVCGTASSLRCSLCRSVYYCSAKHQKKHWKAHKPLCTQQKFEVASNIELGRHLLANETLKFDQIVLKDKLILLGPKLGNCNSDAEGQGSNPQLYCLGCYKDLLDSEVNDPECVHCHLPICSEACSSDHWHNNFECRFFTEANASNDVKGQPSEDVKLYNKVTVIQSLLYFRSFLLKLFAPEAYETLFSLQDNCAAREDLPSLEKTTRIFDDFKKLLSHVHHPMVTAALSKPEVHQLIGIVDTNAAEIQIRANSTLLGIYPTFAMVEHSCFPNCRVYFMPKIGSLTSIDLYVRTLSRIEAGQHISTSYTNLLWNTEKRREDLKKRKYFLCACARCMDPTELGSNFSTIRCPVSDCSSFSVPMPKCGDIGVKAVIMSNTAHAPNTEPIPSTSESAKAESSVELPKKSETAPKEGESMQWQCQQCCKTIESWQVAKVDKRLAEMVSRLKPIVDSYREMLRAMEELVHPNYYLKFIVNHSLIQLFGKDDLTRNDKIVLDEKIKICNQLLGVVKVIDPGLGYLHLYAAVVYYEMQSAILALAGGEGEDDFKILRANPESVKLAKIYLQKAINCFQYEHFPLPENRLKVLAEKKMEYLNMVIKHFKK